MKKKHKKKHCISTFPVIDMQYFAIAKPFFIIFQREYIHPGSLKCKFDGIFLDMVQNPDQFGSIRIL